MHLNDPFVSKQVSYGALMKRGREGIRKKNKKKAAKKANLDKEKQLRENQVMAAPTSPLHPSLQPSIIQYTFRSNSQCLLDISPFFSVLYLPLLFSPHCFFLRLSVTFSYSPEMTSGMRDPAVKCQNFIDVYIYIFLRILIKASNKDFFKG